MAEFESEMRGEQWRDGQRHRVNSQLMPGGPPPFGYMRGNDDNPNVPHQQDPITGPVLYEIYDRYLRGQGPQRIAKWLNDEGYRTPPRKIANRGDTEPTGGKFSVATIVRILDGGFGAAATYRCTIRIAHTCDAPATTTPDTAISASTPVGSTSR